MENVCSRKCLKKNFGPIHKRRLSFLNENSSIIGEI